jgi:hypothetical protein
LANPPYPGYLSPSQIAQAAERQAAQAVAAALAEIEASAQGRGEAIQGFSQAAAAESAKAAPMIQQAYQGAARDTASFAQGYSQGFQEELRKSEGDLNAFLAKQGAPEGQMIQPSGAADVLYGIAGAQPASSLAQQGAAFTAAAGFLPSAALGRGQYLQAEMLRDAEAERKKLRGKKDELRSSIFRDLSQDQTAKYATNIQAQALGVKQTAELREWAEFATEMTGEIHVVKGGQVVNTGRVATGSDAWRNEQAAADKEAKNAAKGKTTRAAAVKSMNSAFRQARKGAIKDARQMVKEAQGGAVYGPKKKVSFQEAYDALYATYADDLLRFAGPSGRGSLQQRIDKMIREALRVAGIVPKKRVKPVNRAAAAKPRGG